jgi:thiol-disulfide isomerase/thioredoxin
LKKTFAPLVLAAILPLFSCHKEEMKGPPMMKSYDAPAIELGDVFGKKVALSDFKGKPVMVNFWATWCAPCVGEMPQLQKLQELRKAAGLVVIEVNYKEPGEVVEKFVKKYGVSLIVLVDDKGVSAQKYEVFGLPTTYFIDKDGVVKYSYLGELTREVINMGLKKIGVEEI